MRNAAFNFASKFLSLFLLVFTSLLLSLSLTFGRVDKAEENESSLYFRNLEKTVVYIQPPLWDDKEAIRCHEKEELCANEYEARIPEYIKSTSMSRDEYIKKLKQDFLNYAVLFQSKTFKDFIANILSNNLNIKTEPLFLESEKETQDYLKRKNTLIVKISNYKHTGVEPPITVLQISFIRPDLSQELFALERAIPLPTGLSKEKILEMVADDLKALYMLVAPKH